MLNAPTLSYKDRSQESICRKFIEYQKYLEFLLVRLDVHFNFSCAFGYAIE